MPENLTVLLKDAIKLFQNNFKSAMTVISYIIESQSSTEGSGLQFQLESNFFHGNKTIKCNFCKVK